MPIRAGAGPTCCLNPAEKCGFRAVADALCDNREAFTRRFGVSPVKKNLLYLGRIHREKNVDTLIRATPLIRGCHADTHRFIVGVGYEQPMLERLARRCGATATLVSAATWRTTGSRRHILRAVSSSSRPWWSSSMAMLEAMACGKALLIVDSTESGPRISSPTMACCSRQETPKMLRRSLNQSRLR